MKNIENLIQHIKQCNLSEDDKRELISILEGQTPDINKFLHTFLNIMKVGKEVLKFYDIDIGDN